MKFLKKNSEKKSLWNIHANVAITKNHFPMLSPKKSPLFFYYHQYNRTLGESLSRISDDIASIAPPGDSVYTRNWHLCDLMRAPSLFFCFSRCSEATPRKCPGVHPQGQERASGMQVRMFAISHTNVNCFPRAGNTRDVGSRACAFVRLPWCFITTVVSRFYPVTTCVYVRSRKKMAEYPVAVFPNMYNSDTVSYICARGCVAFEMSCPVRINNVWSTIMDADGFSYYCRVFNNFAHTMPG